MADLDAMQIIIPVWIIGAATILGIICRIEWKRIERKLEGK